MKVDSDLLAKILATPGVKVDGCAPVASPPPVDNMTEKEFQAQVIDVAESLGWKCYHTYDSRKSAAGFPDLVLVRDRVIFVELKTESGVVSGNQQDWIDALRGAKADARVIRPSMVNLLWEALS